MGGYPNFTPLYERLGFQVSVENRMRKALKSLKKSIPAVIVAEFNFQSDFRDRTSSLESLLSVAQRHIDTRVIVFYEPNYSEQYARLLSQFSVHKSLTFPIDEQLLEAALV